jgi:hypothetical protein
MMKQRRKWALRALISLGLLAAVCAAIFFSLPALLIAPAIEAKSDVMLCDAISKHSTANKYLLDLYRQGMARKIVCVGSQTSYEIYPSDYMRESLISQGARPEDVISLRAPISPCGKVYLTNLAEFVKSNGWKSALYITHPENSRYSGALARKLFEREGVSLAVSYSRQDGVELARDWRRTHWKAQRLFGEVMIIALDRFYSECR